MAGYGNLHWTSADGLQLHARDYPGDPARLPLVCLPGLTRNARDYAALAESLAGGRRVIAASLRGRGESAHARDAGTYVPATYADDVEALLAAAGIGRFVVVGTSLGGIVAMLLAARGAPIAGAVLNDAGPEIEAAGLHRIGSLAGRGSNCPTWLHAARCVQEVNRDVYPDYGLEAWLAMAKRLYRVTSAGRIVLDYDLRIAEPLRTAAAVATPDLWTAFEALAPVPTLVVRGERSDVLGARVADRMMRVLAEGTLVTVPRVGHAPTLAEPEAAAALARLLARADAPHPRAAIGADA